jgi:hypothetical protein
VRKLNPQKLKAAFFLSMIILGSLFLALILSELIPALRGVTQTLRMAPATWLYVVKEPARQYPDELYDHHTVPTLDTNEVTVKQEIDVGFSWFFGTDDEARVRLSINATVKSGFLSGVSLTFQDTKPSILWWSRTSIELNNLFLARSEDSDYNSSIPGWNGHAKLELSAITRTSQIGLSARLVWPIVNSENATNRLRGEITYVYFSGSTFKSIVQPIQLDIMTSTALGIQYFDLRAIAIGSLPINLTGAKVWIDDVEYSFPVSIAVYAGNRTLTAEEPAYLDDEKYIFVSWTDWDGNSYGNPLWVGSESKTDLKAFYVKVYSLETRVEPEGTGFVSVSSSRPIWFLSSDRYEIESDANAFATATALPGYSFSNWSLDGLNYSQNPITIMMDSNHTLTAHFTQTYNARGSPLL